MLAKFVDRATMAFTKMNATDTPAVWRISARPVSKSNGLSKRPPPTPVRPEIRPIAAPATMARTTGILG